jgi:hypothetical protein
MLLDRNIPGRQGRGKYALLLIRNVMAQHDPAVADAIHLLTEKGLLDFGNRPDTDFFVIRLKDKYAWHALQSYAVEAADDDVEYAGQIYALAEKAQRNPFKKRPD